MGYTARFGASIMDFQPDNNKHTLYLSCEGNAGYSLSQIIDSMVQHFGEHAELDDFDIQAEYIHTKCINYDAYDPEDWTPFIVIRCVANHEKYT